MSLRRASVTRINFKRQTIQIVLTDVDLISKPSFNFGALWNEILDKSLVGYNQRALKCINNSQDLNVRQQYF